ncbi:MAG: glycosyltransferase family 4 protein [Nanoarchaeota archaeon]
MKVLHLISSSGYFGAENVIVTLAQEQIKSGICLFIGAFNNLQNPHLEITRRATEYNISIKIFDCYGQFDLKTLKQIRNFININKIDIIHSHGYKANFYTIFARLCSSVKIITTCHNWITNCSKMKLYEKIDKMLLRYFDKIVVVSELLKAEVQRSGIPINKIVTICNSINTESFISKNTNFEKLRESLGININEKVVITVGRVTSEKGHIYLLEAAEKVLKNFNRVKFLIVGDGKLLNFLKVKARELKIENKVIFAGMRNDIPDLLNIGDVFILPSLTEGMPISLLEAMATRKAIIASRVGAIPKMIDDRVSGLLVSPGNVGELANSISELIDDNERINFLGSNAFSKVNSEFSSKKMTEEYFKQYRLLKSDN